MWGTFIRNKDSKQILSSVMDTTKEAKHRALWMCLTKSSAPGKSVPVEETYEIDLKSEQELSRQRRRNIANKKFPDEINNRQKAQGLQGELKHGWRSALSQPDLPAGWKGSFSQDAESAAGQQPATVSLL